MWVRVWWRGISLTLTISISSPFSMKFHTLGLISSHIPPRSLSRPSSWKVLLTWNTQRCVQSRSMRLNSLFWWGLFKDERGLLYLVDDSLCGRSIWGVQDLPHEQRLQSSPDHPWNGAGLQATHHVVTIGSWKIKTETIWVLVYLIR